MRKKSTGPHPFGILGFVLFLIAWQLIGKYSLAGPSVPSPTQVFAIYAVPWKLALLGRAAASTLTSAALGLFAGTLLGASVAVVAHLLTPLRRGLDLLSVIVNAVPAVALAPILIVAAGRDWTPAMLAAIPSFFILYVTLSTGLRSASARLKDVFTILGASRISRMFYLELPAALPAFLGGLQIAVTAAVVGAIVGEWFGSSTGLGIVILNTMLNFQIALMWAAVVIAAACSLAAYGLIGAFGNQVRKRFS